MIPRRFCRTRPIRALLAQYTAAHLPLPVIPGSEQSAPTQEKGKRHHVG